VNCGVVGLPAVVSALWKACCTTSHCKYLQDPSTVTRWQCLSHLLALLQLLHTSL
jgi:hypothetical protein